MEGESKTSISVDKLDLRKFSTLNLDEIDSENYSDADIEKYINSSVDN